MKRILVVDDSSFAYNEIMEIVPPEEYEVVGHAKDGEEGIRLYEELKPDIVTMDIIMPGIDGMEAAKEIIARDPSATHKIVMLSSLCDMDTLEEVHALGMKHLIPKPIEKDILLFAISHLDKNDEKKEKESSSEDSDIV